jgi:hypothetical protein
MNRGLFVFSLLIGGVSAVTFIFNIPQRTFNDIHKECQHKFGPNYRFVPSHIGYLVVADFEEHFGSLADGEDGVRIVSGSPGEK